MKRVLMACAVAALLLVVSGNVLAGDLCITKVGFNTNGYLSFTPSNPPGAPFGSPVYGGCVISIEQLFELSNHLELGYGLEVQFGGTVNINKYFKGVPVFLSLYYHPTGIDEGGYYFLGRIGFNFYGYYGYDDYYNYYSFRDPMIYGFYYAMGGGFQISEFPVIRLEAFLSGNNGSEYYYTSPGFTAYTKYTKLTIAIGFGTVY